jgi:hypothetical protein
MPTDDRSGLHDLDGASPTAPDSRELHPTESISSTEPEPSGRGLLEDGELVAEGQDLRVEFGSSTGTGTGRCQEGDEAWTHDS